MRDDQMLFEALPQPATLIDTEGIIVDVNAAFVDLMRNLGRAFSKAERIGFPVEQFAASPESRAQMKAAIGELLRSGAAQHYRWKWQTSTGEVHHTHLELRPLKDPAGRLTGGLLLRQDITAQVWQEQQRASRERLRDAFWQLRRSADIPQGLQVLYAELKTLLPQLGNCSVQVRQTDTGKWITYAITQVRVRELSEETRHGQAVETCWREQRPVYRPDVTQQDDPYDEAAYYREKAPQVRTVLDVPFPQGTIAVNSRQPHAFSEPEIEALTELAHVLSAGLARIAELKSQARYRALVETPSDMIVMYLAPDGRYLYVSPQLEKMTGYSPEAFYGDAQLGRRIAHPGDGELAERAFARVAAGGPEERLELRLRHKDNNGAERWVLETVSPIHDAAGELEAVQRMLQDITPQKQAEAERIELERQFQQTQKLDSLGVLAGGIAHDFNNLLTVVQGNAQLALMELSPLSPARTSIESIQTAAQRAAELCRQMMAYAGMSSFTLEPVDLVELIEEMVHLLKSSISKKAILNLNLERDLPPIQADPSQLRQIVMNLIVNASEAIGQRSGVITIAVGATRCDAEYLRNTELAAELEPGFYLHLEVADTGCGMDAATRQRLFEPFFTTKFTGRGLGLAAVLGIVRAHRGALKVYSEPNKGTTFKLLFPALENSLPPGRDASRATLVGWQGKGTVLLADDEESVLATAARMLERLGFTVLTAVDGLKAVELYRQRGEEIDQVLLDLTMPNLDGAQAFAQIRRLNPEARIILASGYSQEDVAARFAGKRLTGVLQKPYNLEQLAELLADLRA